MNKKKLTIISVVLVMIMAVGGILAYLTDTASVTNTFTVGNVDITLDETAVNPDGTPKLDDQGNQVDRVIENNYHLVPGQEYVKDPTITVEPGSEESYVRMILTVTNKSVMAEIMQGNHEDVNQDGVFDYADLFAGWDDATWTYKGFTEDAETDTISFEFRYNGTVSGFDAEGNKAAVELAPLFEKLVVPGTFTNDDLKAIYGEEDKANDDVKVIVTGHAIQKAGFEDTKDAAGEVTKTAEDAAWEAFV